MCYAFINFDVSHDSLTLFLQFTQCYLQLSFQTVNNRFPVTPSIHLLPLTGIFHFYFEPNADSCRFRKSKWLTVHLPDSHWGIYTTFFYLFLNVPRTDIFQPTTCLVKGQPMPLQHASLLILWVMISFSIQGGSISQI